MPRKQAAPAEVLRHMDVMIGRWNSPLVAGCRRGSRTVSKRILFVEDEAAIREMVEHALSRAGFETRTVADAVQAERAIEQEQPDLVLLDWMLPGVSGLEFARKLRRGRIHPGHPGHHAHREGRGGVIG